MPIDVQPASKGSADSAATINSQALDRAFSLPIIFQDRVAPQLPPRLPKPSEEAATADFWPLGAGN
ncbi:MAG: hypothetical protein JWR39_512 [Devosia sp.]|nr:hypothetical protein [Devosia sp.]